MSRRRLLLAAAFAVTVFLIIQSCMVLFAEHYRKRADSLIEDAATEQKDILDISPETLPRFVRAADYLEKAAKLRPSSSSYRKSCADILVKLGSWSRTMATLQEQLPAGMNTEDEYFSRAISILVEAVSLDPANPDLHLALARAYEMNLDREGMARELNRSVEAAPRNAAVRYTVAVQFLLQGTTDEALRHATALAEMDDTYLIPDSPRKRLMVDRRTPVYTRILANSYLMKAFEIAWRASGKNIEVIQRLLPKNDDALPVWDMFLEWKGLQE